MTHINQNSFGSALHIIYASALLIIVPSSLFAQTSSSLDSIEMLTYQKIVSQKLYTIISWNVGGIIWKQPVGNLSVAFPYTSTNKSGDTSVQKNFTGSLNNAFTKKPVVVDILNAEFDKKEHSILLNIGVATNYNHSLIMKLGYGHILPITFFSRKGFPQWQIKASLNFFYLRIREEFGKIDNNNQNLSILGYYAGYQFSTSSKYGTVIHNANDVDVRFAQRNITALPEIKITNTPFKVTNKLFRRVYLNASIGWLYPLIQTSGLYLEQEAEHGSNIMVGLSSRIYNSKYATAAFNNTNISTSPYSFSGFIYSAGIGIYFTK